MKIQKKEKVNKDWYFYIEIKEKKEAKIEQLIPRNTKVKKISQTFLKFKCEQQLNEINKNKMSLLDYHDVVQHIDDVHSIHGKKLISWLRIWVTLANLFSSVQLFMVKERDGVETS
jgi:hypothetical protein